jgi:hypothetical protein
VVAGKLPIRVERFDRPEIKNVIMSMKEFDHVNCDLEIRDLYNPEDAFHMSKEYRGTYRAPWHLSCSAECQPRRLRPPGRQDRLATGPDGAHPLTELLLSDYLIVDISKPYAENSFFEIEWATLQGRSYET